MTAPKELQEQRLDTQESLFRAAQSLEEATGRPKDSTKFVQVIHQALRGCVLAVEFHLDTVSGKQGAGAVRSETPRLIPELERLEASLARCLVQVWEAKSASMRPSEERIAGMRQLAERVRAVASIEHELVHEAARPLGDVD